MKTTVIQSRDSEIFHRSRDGWKPIQIYQDPKISGLPNDHVEIGCIYEDGVPSEAVIYKIEEPMSANREEYCHQ